MSVVLIPLLLCALNASPCAAVAARRQDSPTSVPQYGKFELTLSAPIGGRNPFDPDPVAIDVRFTSPTGRKFLIPAFLNQPFSRRLEGNREVVTPAGKPAWCVRFSPNVPGGWTYQIEAQTADESEVFMPHRLTVTPSRSRGFIRRSSRYPGLFAYDDGRSYFPIGENMCWAGQRGTYDFDRWLGDLHAAGGDWIRLWLTEDKCGIEWSGPKVNGNEGMTTRFAGYHGVGYYSLENAWKLDQILDTAEKNGVNVMICGGTYGEFTTGGFFNEGAWPRNPYNVANGGPCKTPAEFWTNPAARTLYRKRLRYLVARYGWRSNVFGWEFWNEANAPADWIADMARYLKGTGPYAGRPADPYGHLVSTTYGNDAIWRLPEIDFTMTHNYGTGNIPDYAPVIHSDAIQHTAYGKPHLMAEYGIDWRKPDTDYDPAGKGVNLHNGLWSGIASGSGTGMLWWWDNYIAPKNLYGQFNGVRAFVNAMGAGPTGPAWKPLTCDAPTLPNVPETFSDLDLASSGAWGKADSGDYTVTEQGKVQEGVLPTFLYSPGKPELRTTPTLHLNFKRAGRLILHLHQVSASAHLTFALDGLTVKELDLSAAPPADKNTKPDYASTTFEKEYGIYLATYDHDYTLDIPAGPHTVTLAVTAGDWISLNGITLTDYKSSRYADLNSYGMTDGRMAILWVQNPEHNWKRVLDGKPITTLTGLSMRIAGLKPGRYSVAWFDTTSGAVTSRESATTTESGMVIHLPVITTDVAAQIRLERR